MKSQRSFDDAVIPIHLGAIVICVLLLVVGYVFGYAPLMTQSQQETSLLDQAEQAEYEAKQIKQQLDRLADDLKQVQAELDKQPVNLQPASKINPLLAQLADWSEMHGLSITSTNAGRPKALAYYDYVPIKIGGEGSFGELLALFKRMNTDRGDLGLVSFDVNRMPTGDGVSFDLDLAWYVLDDDNQHQDQPTVQPPAQPTASVPVP
jgi:Tfp pilus assembly protein PilO